MKSQTLAGSIRFTALALAMAVVFSPFTAAAHAETTDEETALEKSVSEYTYKITPLLEPFNEYFFVETDNPDPLSFRFADRDTVYVDKNETYDDGESKYAAIVAAYENWEDELTLFADVKYDDEKTARTNGGYIFESYKTDGGEIVLQEKKKTGRYSWEYTWEDTQVKLSLPKLVDCVDYLIDTYADKPTFFENMSAVESGFSSICFYSGSYIRGTIEQTSKFWEATIAFHKDQSFYIYSPFSRRDNRSLFASAIYPYRYDSLGFPSVMGAVSRRLDSGSSYEWDSYNHYLINVTYNGETKSYGGQGNGEGQGIDESDIKKYFEFGSGAEKLTLEDSAELLDYYAALKMSDDIPREGELTWKKIFDDVGQGSWTRLGGNSFIYFYQNGSGDNFWDDEWGGVGHHLYWGGDLGYAHDMWVDGRYVNSRGNFVKGAKFEELADCDIILDNVNIPQISYESEYKYDSESDSYKRVYKVADIKTVKKRVRFVYNETDNVWYPEYKCFDSGCADRNKIAEMTEAGVINKQYLDMVTLTQEEAKALNLDRNTNTYPTSGYRYDGTVAPGTYSDKLDYVNMKWEWDGYDKAVLKVTSLNDETKTETVEAKITSEREEPTCENSGEVIYTAEAEFDGAVFGKYESEYLDKLGHKYKVASIKWETGDEPSAEITFVCENDETHTITRTAWVNINKTDPTCESDGSIQYTASSYYWDDKTNDWVDIVETLTEPLPKLGHKFQFDFWEWDGVKAYAHFICGNCWNETKVIEAQVTAEPIDEITARYTATVTLDGETYTDTKLDAIIADDTQTDTSSDTQQQGLESNSDAETKSDTASDIESDHEKTTDDEKQSDTITQSDSDMVHNDSDSHTDTHTDSDAHSDISDQSDTDTDGSGSKNTEERRYGDIDGDCYITANDSLLILRQSVGLESFKEDLLILCDVDEDNSVTANDALDVLRFSVGISVKTKVNVIVT